MRIKLRVVISEDGAVRPVICSLTGAMRQPHTHARARAEAHVQQVMNLVFCRASSAFSPPSGIDTILGKQERTHDRTQDRVRRVPDVLLNKEQQFTALRDVCECFIISSP